MKTSILTGMTLAAVLALAGAARAAQPVEKPEAAPKPATAAKAQESDSGKQLKSDANTEVKTAKPRGRPRKNPV